MSYITFSTHSKDGKIIKSYSSVACFRDLHDDYFKLAVDSFIKFQVGIKTLNDEIINWFHSSLNSIGLVSEMEKRGDSYFFKVNHQGNDKYTYVLSTLVALRYLEEESLPALVKLMFDNKDKNVGFFNLFQISHIVCSHNSNHTFLTGGIYGGTIKPLISLEEFFENITKESKGYTPGSSYTGISSVMVSKNNLKSPPTYTDLKELLKKGEVLEIQRLLTV